jgi:hypothetical protein
MERLIRTSAGPALVDVTRFRLTGMCVNATPFGFGDWAISGKSWSDTRRSGDPTLGEYLAARLSIPAEEGELLAGEILGRWMEEWEQRGGQLEATNVDRLTVVFMSVLALLVVLAALAVGLFVWLAI